MFITYKETVWRRVEIPTESENRVKELIEGDERLKNFITIGSDLVEELDIMEEHELLLDTTTEIDTEYSQDGYSTVEIWTDDGELIWANGKH